MISMTASRNGPRSLVWSPLSAAKDSPKCPRHILNSSVSTGMLSISTVSLESGDGFHCSRSFLENGADCHHFRSSSCEINSYLALTPHSSYQRCLYRGHCLLFCRSWLGLPCLGDTNRYALTLRRKVGE